VRSRSEIGFALGFCGVAAVMFGVWMNSAPAGFFVMALFMFYLVLKSEDR